MGPRPLAAQDGAYSLVAGDDWSGYADLDDLRAARYFGWPARRDVYQQLRLVPDPLFGRVVQVTFPRNAGAPGPAPRLTRRFTPLDHLWLRFRVRWEPGWTTAAPDPRGHNNSYKLAFLLWDGFDGRGEIRFGNTDQYHVDFSARKDGRWLPYRIQPLPGSAPFGRVGTEWSDGEWYEFVMEYERLADAHGRIRFWRRRLTRDGAVLPGPWTYRGMDLSGAEMPRVSGVRLGVNKNKNNPRDMHLYWGPWEVVDGSRNADPFGMARRFGRRPAGVVGGETTGATGSEGRE